MKRTYLASFTTFSSSALSFLRQAAGEGIAARVGVLALVDGPAVALLAFIQPPVATLMVDDQLRKKQLI